MRKIGAAAAIAGVMVAISVASGGASAAASGNFSGFGTDSDKSTAEWYATNNAYSSAQGGGFQRSECSVLSTDTQPYGPNSWQSTVWVSCYRPDSVHS